MFHCAGESDRTGIDYDYSASLVRRLPQSQGQQRSFGRRIGADQHDQVALANIFKTARFVAQAGGDDSCRTVMARNNFV